MAQRCESDVERTASPFAVTPPLGRRIEVLASTSAVVPADPSAVLPSDPSGVVPVDVDESAATDVELQPMYRRLVRDLRNG